MIAHFTRRPVAAVLMASTAIFAFTTTGCTSPPAQSPYPPAQTVPMQTWPAPQSSEPEELFPQRGDVPQVNTEGNSPVCADKTASLVLVVGNQPRTVERMGVRVTTTRTDDGATVSFSPYNDTLIAGIVDGREVISLDDGDDGLYGYVALRNDRFAPVDKHGDTDPKYRIGKVELCNGGA